MRGLHYFEQILRNLWRRGIGAWVKLYLLLHGCRVGKGFKCYAFPRFRAVPFKNIVIGNHVTLGYDCTLEVLADALLEIQDHANITQNVLISCSKHIRIGAYSLIGENVSIRDAEHRTLSHELISCQSSVAERIEIGKDVWIGAGSLVLRGASIAEGAIIGAKSLVNRSADIQASGIYVGTPVHFLKQRDNTQNT